MKEQIGYWALLKENRNFRNLYFARLVSLFGDWFHLLAVLTLLRSMGDASAGSFGLILILKMLPSVFLSPIAGVVTDRYSRRKIMIFTDWARAFLVLLMLGMIWFPNALVLYILVILQACVAVFFDPARSAMLPDIVTPEELTAANALSAATWSAMLTLGTAIGGVFTSFFGWEAALVVDILSYLVSIVLLLRIVEPSWQKNRKPPSGWKGILGLSDLQEGIVYMRSKPRVLSLALVKFGWCIIGGATLILTLIGENFFMISGMPLLAVTILYVSRGAGTGIGPIVARWFSRSRPDAMEKMILVGYLFGAFSYAIVSFSTYLSVTVFFVFCAHLGGATCWVFSTVRLQQLLPTEIRGRVFAAEQTALTASIAFSIWAYGFCFDHQIATLETLILCMGCSLFVPAFWWWRRGKRLGWGDVQTTSAK